MKTQASTQAPFAPRQAGAIPFTVLARLARIPLPHAQGGLMQLPFDGSPEGVKLDDHLPRYHGCVTDPRLFIWGIYGTADRQQARSRSFNAAQTANMHMLEIEGKYMLDDFHLVRSGLDRKAVLKTGYLHADRLKASFRKELTSFLLEVSSNRHPEFDAAAHESLPLGNLLLEQPMLVQDLFDMLPRLMMLVHRVRPDWDPKSRLGVHVCTMRRTAERILDVRVQHLPAVAVYC